MGRWGWRDLRGRLGIESGRYIRGGKKVDPTDIETKYRTAALDRRGFEWRSDGGWIVLNLK